MGGQAAVPGKSATQAQPHSRLGGGREATSSSTPVTTPSQVLQYLLRAGVIQAKLAISQPGDRLEREADQTAEAVMRMPSPSPPPLSTADSGIQRKCSCSAGGGHVCDKCSKKEEQKIQAKEAPGRTPSITPQAEAQVAALRGGGQPLPTTVRSFFEPRFGRDFSGVRVHQDQRANEAASAVQARAFTLGRDIVFGPGQFAPQSSEGQRLLAHELAHTVQQGTAPSRAKEASSQLVLRPAARGLLQRAEVDDNPAFCRQPNGAPLQDVRGHVNNWVQGAQSNAKGGLDATQAVYKELGTGTGVTNAEHKLGALPATHVRHVKMGESRYSGTGIFPVDPFSKLVLGAAGKIFLAPVVNLCGTCVGTDKVGHFFQQGYEYFRLAQALRARVEAMSPPAQQQMYERLGSGLPEAPVDGVTKAPGFQFQPPVSTELVLNAFVAEFGKWLEGFDNRLSPEDIRWIRSQSFIHWYYFRGIYGEASTGVLSRADLEANRRGFDFYKALSSGQGKTDICEYVGELWSERKEPSSVSKAFPGNPAGPVSSSRQAENH